MKQEMIGQGAVVVLIVAIVAAIVGGAIVYFLMPAPEEETPPEEVNALVFYHWWTSGGEAAALNALIDVFKSKYPDTAIMPAPVTGGAGYTMMGVIKPMVLAGEAPDAFQMHAGYEGKPYFDADLLDPIDDIWASEGLEAVIPEVVRSMCMFEGHYYAMPVNIHRVNVIWYYKPLLDANGIDPATLTTWDDFFAACDTLKAAGVTYPIACGETSWMGAHNFEQILANEGIEFYEDWVNGKITDPNDPKLLHALDTFEKYMSYANPDHAAIKWDAMVASVITGESAFHINGDWSNGEFYVAEKEYGVDYGTIPVPGTGGMYGLCIDCFQHPAGIVHPTNSDRWLKVVGSKEGQNAFNIIKGSIACRTDVDTSTYPAYHRQSAFPDFATATYMYPSVAHGSGAPEAFKVKLAAIMSAFTADYDITAAAEAMTSYTTEIAEEYTVVWDLY